ncbi:MAG: hypothetical protein NZ805_00740 [Armatimonadetes bacterium]|nr:hypothetical protein [Armatimonadota bacterium]MDW8029009.1 hypothetical protein [Armatimonadota bacterium]
MVNRQIAWMSSLFAVSCALCQITMAMWVRPASAPLERLLPNIQHYVQQNPKDAHGHYVLARLHSLAFARGVKTQVHYMDMDATNRLI